MRRFHEALMSIYLYNEHRGYTQLEALEAALRRTRPNERALVQAVHEHAADERRHYRMFRAWFVRHGVMPLRVDAASGYIDRLVKTATGKMLDAVDLEAVTLDDRELQQLFRLIVLTERRGLAQVRSLLRARALVLDRELSAIFKVVERDEPAHFEPYATWLEAHGAALSTWRERTADALTHWHIVLLKMPSVMSIARSTRLEAFPA